MSLSWPTWQQMGAAVVVLAAVVYLIWKMSWGSRPPRRRKKGPDVPTSQLTRKKREGPKSNEG